MTTYASYGLRIASDLDLELPSADPGAPDVIVSRAALPRPSAAERPEGDGCWRADEAEALYFWADAGAFRARAGRTIEVDPEPGVTEEAVRLVVLSRLIGAVLHQRGLLVLHASAVAGPGGAVAVAAHSGSGKSTSAAVLARRGYRLLTDDILALDLSGPEVVVRPGGSGLKLWPRSAEAVGADEPGTIGGDVRPVAEGSEKRMWRMEAPAAPTPLAGLYVLAPEPGPTLAALSKPQAVIEVMERSYCSEELRWAGAERNLEQATGLVRRVPVRLLRRPRTLDAFDAWAATFAGDAETLLGA